MPPTASDTDDNSIDGLDDEELAFLNVLVEEAISSSDTDRQDIALRLQEKLPESRYSETSQFW